MNRSNNRRNYRNRPRNQTPRYNGAPMVRSNPDGWCLPTVIYLLIAVLGIIFSGLTGRYNMAPLLMLGEVIHTVFWTAVLYWFCSIGWSGVSWLILLLPLILIFFLILYEVHILRFLGHEEKAKEVHIKRTYQIYY